MNTQTWTLIGVVVGAVLGGVAQVTAGSLQRSFERARIVRDFRREAYARFFHAVLLMLQEQMRWHRNRAMEPPQPTPRSNEEPPAAEAWERMIRESDPSFDASIGLQEALVQVELIAPDDTFRAADSFYKQLTQLSRSIGVDQDGEVTGDGDASKEREALIALCKRDIGLSGRA